MSVSWLIMKREDVCELGRICAKVIVAYFRYDTNPPPDREWNPGLPKHATLTTSLHRQTPVAARARAWTATTVGQRVGVPPEAWVCVRVFLCAVLSCAMGRSPAQGVLPNVRN
jgi:hypothetical protein